MQNELENFDGLADLFDDDDVLNSLRDILADWDGGTPIQQSDSTAEHTYIPTMQETGAAKAPDELFSFELMADMFPAAQVTEQPATTSTAEMPDIMLDDFPVSLRLEDLAGSSGEESALPEKESTSSATATPPKTWVKVGKIIFNCVFYLFCIAIVAGAATFTFSRDPRKSYLGYRLYMVKTPSMTPQKDGPSGGFYAGDLIVVKLVKPETLNEGDIITFVPNKNNPNSFLTHRLVEIKDKMTNDPDEEPGLYFVTRGDANDSDDPPISADIVIGKKMFSIRKVGQILQYVQDNLVLSLVFTVSAFGFLFTLRYYFSGSKKKEKEKSAA